MSGNTTLNARIILSAKNHSGPVLNSFKGNLNNIGRAVTGVHAKLLSLVGVGGFGALMAGVISTGREFQNLHASLVTVTGSTYAADAAFKTIEKFAVNTPYQLTEVVDAFTRLKSMGLDPSERALRSYGNTSSAMGKSLNQMIEAVADAATGEFERLKEFGIRASKQGDNISFTFQGITKTVKNNSEAIQEYLLAIGENQFAGGMQNQMKTIGGAFSNLEDSVDKLKRTIGNAGINDLVIDTTRGITAMIEALKPEQVEGFVRSAMTGFADLIDGAERAYKYIEGNQYLQASGIVGYMLFGKWGVAGALALSGLTDKVGADAAKAWEEWNPSQVVNGSGGFGGKAGYNPNPQYRLGDFNDRVGGRGSDFDKWVDQLRNNPQIDESNTFLSSIADQLRARAENIGAGPSREEQIKQRLFDQDEAEIKRIADLLAQKNADAEALMKKALGIRDGSYQLPTPKGRLEKLIIGPSNGLNKVIIDDSKQINRTNELLIEIKEELRNQNKYAVAG